MKPDKQCQKRCANYGYYNSSTCQMCMNRSNLRGLSIVIDVVENEWGDILRRLAD